MNLKETQNELISVIIPNYNSGKFLGEAIESVVNQTYKNIEIIVINDGSTDNTEEIAKKWQKRDERVRYLKHKENKGPSAARNTGIKNSRGEYIAFLDADDVWLPKKIEIQINKINDLDADLVFSNWYIWEPIKNVRVKAFNSNPLGNKEDLLCLFIKKNFGNPSTALLKKSSLEKIGLFDESLKSSEDYDLWLRFILKGMKIVFCIEPFIYSRKHPEQMTANTYRMRTSRLAVFKKIIQNEPNTLIKCPVLVKKIIFLQGYKFIQDFLKILGIRKR